METVNYSQARQNLKGIMDRVCDSSKPLLITRRNREPVVMMSMQDYRSTEETLYLLRSPENAKRLLEGMKEKGALYDSMEEMDAAIRTKAESGE